MVAGSLDQPKVAHLPRTCHSGGKKRVAQPRNSPRLRSRDCWHLLVGRSYSQVGRVALQHLQLLGHLVPGVAVLLVAH